MDNRAPSIHEILSRASTPPTQGQQFPGPQAQQVQQPSAPQQQHAPQPPDSSSSDLIDSLFQHIITPQETLTQKPAEAPQSNPDNYQISSPRAAPPASLKDDQPTSSSSPPAPSVSSPSAAQERQNALLSLFNNPAPVAPPTAPASASARSVAAPSNAPPQQIPTPPGSSRSNASPSINQTENQKILLEQLMGRWG